jgi:hypothetical protein
MKTNVSSTSILAFHGLTNRGTQQDRICEYVEQGAATINMVADGLGMRHSTVSARMNELRKSERLELSHIGKDPLTGVTAKFWRVAPEQTNLLERIYDESH